LADPSSPFFAQKNSVGKGGKKVRERKENIEPRKQNETKKKSRIGGS
jgi:hypothetical protein